jgi:hypothetical protein
VLVISEKSASLVKATGSYDWKDSFIEGDIYGNVISGMWFKSPSYETPKDAGEIEFTISEDVKFISGIWKYADSDYWSGIWDGVRAD